MNKIQEIVLSIERIDDALSKILAWICAAHLYLTNTPDNLPEYAVKEVYELVCAYEKQYGKEYHGYIDPTHWEIIEEIPDSLNFLLQFVGFQNIARVFKAIQDLLIQSERIPIEEIVQTTKFFETDHSIENAIDLLAVLFVLSIQNGLDPITLINVKTSYNKIRYPAPILSLAKNVEEICCLRLAFKNSETAHRLKNTDLSWMICTAVAFMPCSSRT